MSTTNVTVSLAICTSSRWPYYRVRVLGPRQHGEPGELVVPIMLKIDDALLKRQTARVVIEMPNPETPTGRVEGA